DPSSRCWLGWLGRRACRDRHRIAPLDGAIVIPQHMRRHPAPRPPWLRERDHLLRGRPRLHREDEPRRLLQREIAGRPGIGMAEAEQEIDVGAPGADAVEGRERAVGVVGLHRGERIEIDLALGDRRAERLHGPDLRLRQAEPRELGGARAPHRVVVKRIEGGDDTPPDRARARSRQLLCADDGAQALKTRGPPAQVWAAGTIDEGAQPRIAGDKLAKAAIEIGVVVQEAGDHRARLWIAARAAAMTISAMPVFRFAPSPNGFLHLGHALSALVNFEMARAAGGRLLLRIEDIDAARCRPQYEEA